MKAISDCAGFGGLAAGHTNFALRRLGRRAMSGVSATALGLALVALQSVPAQAQIRDVVDGDAAGGYMITNSGVYSTNTQNYINASDIGTLAGSQLSIDGAVFTNFVTQGGAGSGGGAGLGGVFFVNSGTSLVLNNVDFTANTVVGGVGGSAPAVDVGTVEIGLASIEYSLLKVMSLGNLPTASGSGTVHSAFSVTSMTVDSKLAKSLRVGMPVMLPGVNDPVRIQSIAGNVVTFDAAAPLPASGFYGDAVWNQEIPTQTNTLRFSDAEIDVLWQRRLGGQLVINGAPEDLHITAIDNDTNTVTFSGDLPPAVLLQMQQRLAYLADQALPPEQRQNLPFVAEPTFDFVTLIDFEASHVTETLGDEIVLAAYNPMIRKGMVLTGEGLPSGGVVVDEMVTNPDGTFTLTVTELNGDPASLAADTVYEFDAELAAITVDEVAHTTRVVTSKTGLAEGMLVSGNGVPPGTRVLEVGDGYVVLDSEVTNIEVGSLNFSAIASASGTTITVANPDLLIGVEDGMVVTGPGIPDGATVISADETTGVLILSAVDDPTLVADLFFADPKAQGGSLNNINQSITGTTGQDGLAGVPPSPLTGDGEGDDGKRGGVGGNALTPGAGGTGGRGGDGSDAMGHNPALIKGVADTTVTAVANTASFVASLVPDPPWGSTDVAEAVVNGVNTVQAYVDLAFAIEDLVRWEGLIAEGRVAVGGSGGDGGKGGKGSEFHGGGSGGNGGDGGDAGRSNGVAGDGGSGGAGGDGGFGAGGGAGGAGGSAGSGNYSAIDGDGGDGGSGGFGGGHGSNGDGENGEGGDGFGGAIFVRSGGNLSIGGNSTFWGNNAAGGSSTNGGEGGKEAGTDLFMMKGSTVNITPGAGNVVTFHGSIADDSKASYTDASNGKGHGAGLTIGSGLTIFNGVNTYSGQTQIVGGALKAQDGVNIHSFSNINFGGSGRTGSLSEANAGVLLTTGYFNRELGSGAGQENRVQWTGSGGFAALGGDLTINLGAIPNSTVVPGNPAYASTTPPKTLTWGANGFFSTIPNEDAALVFGSEYADSAVYFLNGIDLNGDDRQIVVATNDDAEDTFAVIEGVISNGHATEAGLIVGDAANPGYEGMLILRGENTYNGGTDVRSGTLVVDGNGTLGGPGNALTVGQTGTMLIMSEQDLGHVENDGAIVVAADVEADSVDNNASALFVMAADVTVDGNFTNDGHLLVVGNDGSPLEDTERTLTTAGFQGGVTGTVTIGGAHPEDYEENEGTTFAVYHTDDTGTTYAGVVQGDGSFEFDGVNDAHLTLTGVNTYTGTTDIASGVTLALSGDGSISNSAVVTVDGTFDISATTDGTSIVSLAGGATGVVELGDLADPNTKTLTITEGSTEFAGGIEGTGGVIVEASTGTQTFSGENTYTGDTEIELGGTLALIGTGSIADSAEVIVDGTFDIAGTDIGAEIITLSGAATGVVKLGDLADPDTKTLTITEGSTEFAGGIEGTGHVVIEASAGTQTFSGENTYTGRTDIQSDGTLALIGTGSIAASELVTVDGTFDITGTTAGAQIIALGGTDGDAQILLGDQTLALTGDGDSSYAGIIVGTTDSGLTVEGGSLTLTGASPDFDGTTTIEQEAELILVGAGSITGSAVDLAGVLDISGVTTPSAIPGYTTGPGTSIFDLSGTGEIILGTNTLAVSNVTAGNTFSGPITGTGAFGVSGGGPLNLDFTGNPTVNANIFAATGGELTLMGSGTIDPTGSSQSALSVVNGGTIKTGPDAAITLVTAATEPTVSVLFDNAGGTAHVDLGAGTVLQNAGSLLEVTRTGAGSEAGNVEFIIDNASVVVGNILDLGATPGEGFTTVYIGEGVNWTGRVVAGDFLVEAGASAHFQQDSVLNNLTAEAGALLNSVTGNLNILGLLTLNANGLVAPGDSPGAYNTLDFASNDSAYLMSVRFGQANPLPGDGNDYSQINVRRDFTGTPILTDPGVLGIVLERHESTQATPLVDLEDFELLRIGGTEIAGSNVYLAERFTQNGRELLLDRRVRDVVDGATVVGANAAYEEEWQFFNPDPGAPISLDPYDLSLTGIGDLDSDQRSIIVYGLRSIVQDETYGLATLTGTLHQAGRETLGTFLERRGARDLESNWMRAGIVHTEVGDTVSNVQDLAFGQYGVDLVEVDGLRAGVIGSYSSSTSGVETETGTAGLAGNVWSGGVYGTWASGGAYIDAVGQYGYSDWVFSPTAASNLTIAGHTALAALEAGFTMGNEHASVTPWSQLVWQTTLYDGMQSAWAENAEFDSESLHVRGGLRAEGRLGGFAPYLDLSLSHDFNDTKTVTVDGFDFTTGMGGTRAEVGAGFQAELSENAKLWSHVKGAYGIEEGGDVLSYQGQAGVRATW